MSKRQDALQARQTLARELLAAIPDDAAERGHDPARWRTQELLAQLLEFHRREEKPAWWRMFDREAMTPEELSDDLDCLGSLTRTAEPRVSIKYSAGFWYAFDPDQDTKLHAGADVYLVPGLLSATIEKLDPEGRVLVKLGPKALGKLPGGVPPGSLALIPREVVSAGVIEDAILAVVSAWRDTRRLPPALACCLRRERPFPELPAGEPLVRDGEDALDAALRLVTALDHSCLCIQGPPGTGKTFTAATVIKSLLARGLRVGVTSSSHKAIQNLMAKTNELMDGQLDCLKAGGPADDPFFEACPGARHLSSKDAAESYAVGLVGGTAWFFSRDDMAERLDYLFVDEAGQVSLANLVGMSRAARNFVILGDQMQLAQPTQGSHPGKSGLSVLDYLLQDHATIPDDLGLFLPRSYRMHPDVCRFISGVAYEDRLGSQPGTARRLVRLPGGPPGLVTREAGLLFVPVEHEGNSQASEEEVAAICGITAGLVGRDCTDTDGRPAGALHIADILYVAPYNMQVRKLQRALPPGARVASVDKFQGQEARVVIISLCASPGEQGPRGLAFLLDKNRLNVAISRAQSLAIIVGEPRLAHDTPHSIPDLQRLNLLCRLVRA